jgi:hypothetical protein
VVARALTARSISLSADASRFVREHGGRAYVWSARGGLLTIGVSGSPGIAFTAFAVDGVEVLVDERLELPDEFELVLRRVPWRRLGARWRYDDGAGSWPDYDGGGGGGD